MLPHCWAAIYFAAAETAFASASRPRLRAAQERGDHRAKKALWVCDRFDKTLTTILIGNNIVNISATTVATVLCTKLFQEYGPTVATVALTVIILIFGEITPKSYAKKHPEKYKRYSSFKDVMEEVLSDA